MGDQYHFDPDTYLATVRAEVPAYHELQDAIAAATGRWNRVGLETIARAALAHDAGKGEVSAEALHRVDPLADLEWAEVTTHPERGASLLRAYGWDDPVAIEVAVSHHERADGSGYPHGLRGHELAPEVRVNSVAPGWVDTDLSEPAYRDGGREEIAAGIPIGRIASAEDVAAPILFLASAAARHLTGEILNVNGGAVLCG